MHSSSCFVCGRVEKDVPDNELIGGKLAIATLPVGLRPRRFLVCSDCAGACAAAWAKKSRDRYVGGPELA